MDDRPPESINYYESYFMDSFVGEFSGEVKDDKLDQQINEMNWCDEQKIENALEFGFDSFGPESLLFQTNGDNLITNQVKKLETIKESSEKSELRNDAGEEQVNRSDNDEDEPTVKKVKKSITSLDELSEHLIANHVDYDDLVSLSVSEPQLKQKLDSCFDKNKIRNCYDIAGEPKSILAFDRSLSGDEQHEYEFDNKQFNDHLHNHLDGQFDNHIMNTSDKQHNKSTDSRVEEFRLNDEHRSTDNLEDGFNSLIENAQFKQSINNGLKNDSNEIEQTSDLNADVGSDNSTAEITDQTVNSSNTDANNTANSNSSNTIINSSIEERTLTGDSFKRQSTLTKSQRRRISPKFKFEEMPSTSDDVISNDNDVDDILDQLVKQQDQLNNVPLKDNQPLNNVEIGNENSQPEGNV